MYLVMQCVCVVNGVNGKEWRKCAALERLMKHVIVIQG
jgi:hypothetical protein